MTSWATSRTVIRFRAADPVEQRRDGRLVREVEAVERLVEEEHPRLRDERRGDQEPLLLAARAVADRPPGVARGADELDRLLDAAPLDLPAGQRQPPAGSVEAEPDEIDAADPGRRVEGVALRQVADLPLRGPGRRAEHGDRPRAQGLLAEEDAQECRLAGAVRAEHGDELARLDPEGRLAPDRLRRRA